MSNKKAKAWLYGTLAVLLIGWCTMNLFKQEEKLYYIPQLEMYLKIVKKPVSKYGYVLFSKDSLFSLSDSADYVKVYSYPDSGDLLCLFVDPSCNDKLYVDVKLSKIKNIKEDKYEFTEIKFGDSRFYEKRHLSNPLKRKKPYLNISIGEAFQRVYVTNYDEIYGTEIFPIVE